MQTTTPAYNLQRESDAQEAAEFGIRHQIRSEDNGDSWEPPPSWLNPWTPQQEVEAEARHEEHERDAQLNRQRIAEAHSQLAAERIERIKREWDL
jgi:hypothetical protein